MGAKIVHFGSLEGPWHHEKNRTEKIDALTMKPFTEVKTNFQPAKYVMITGDRAYSPQNAQDVKEIAKDMVIPLEEEIPARVRG